MSQLSVFTDSYCMKNGASKPVIPYTLERHFVIRPHIPTAPSPLTGPGIGCKLTDLRRKERAEVDPLTLCEKYTPSLKQTPNQNQVSLKVVKTIRIGDNEHAQLVLVEILSSASPDVHKGAKLVAKFYDPLYFSDQDDVDQFILMEKEYRAETAVYKQLVQLQGRHIPRFYGSFSLELATRSSHRRVCLILVEFIRGTSMKSMDPAKLQQPVRQQIMKELIDAETSIHAHDVLHRDIAPRNVILRAGEDGKQHVVIIDFGRSLIGRTPQDETSSIPSGVPISPLLRWRKPHPTRESWGKWIDWDWDAWLDQVYEYTQRSITAAMKKRWSPQSYVPRQPLTYCNFGVKPGMSEKDFRNWLKETSQRLAQVDRSNLPGARSKTSSGASSRSSSASPARQAAQLSPQPTSKLTPRPRGDRFHPKDPREK